MKSAGAEPLGHSSARQAGEMASAAGAKRLVLIHYPVFGRDGGLDTGGLVAEAARAYNGPIELAQDFCIYEV